jgi:hypothetical protein
MSIFFGNFSDGVRDQLRTRQNAIRGALGVRTPASIQYFNTRDAWIRMTSSVNVNGDNNLAQSNVLFSGNLGSGVGSGRGSSHSTTTLGGRSNRLGIRPMPGITSLDVKTKAAYGSLREATVSFVCWDIRQLEELEVLYMRPGYSVLVEWGWNPYLTNAGGIDSNSAARFNNGVLNGGTTKENIWNTIINQSALDGNYDAIYGLIKNYSWSAREDGGYDCSTTIITLGEIMESLKFNYSGAEVGKADTVSNFGGPTSDPLITDSYSQNIIAGLCAELYKVAKINGTPDTPYQYNDPNSGFTYDLYLYTLPITNPQQPTIVEDNIQIYTTLHDFIRILNFYALPEDQDRENLCNLSTFDSNGDALRCLVDRHQISTNPTVCLVNNEYYNIPTINGVSGVTVPTALKSFLSSTTLTFINNTNFANLGEIGNIYINLDYAYRLSVNTILNDQDKKEKNDIVVFDYLKALMSGVNTAIGSFNNFNLFIDPVNSNTLRIIDVNYTGNKAQDRNNFEIQLQNLGSVVRSYKLESQIFPEQSSIIAIGAQVQGGTSSNNVNTLVDYNQNLTDRIITSKNTSQATPLSPADKLRNTQENYGVFLFELFGGNFSWFRGDYDIEQSSRFSGTLRDLINLFQTYTNPDSGNRAIIPTKLSIEMDGIGGIIIGNIFRISNDVLPRGYQRGAIGYAVTGISHTIQNNDWVTKIDAQFILLDDAAAGLTPPNINLVSVPFLSIPPIFFPTT